MSNAVKAVHVLINTYKADEELAAAVASVFESNEDFLAKVSGFDAHFNKSAGHEPVREYAFDLLMAHHLEMNNEDEDYFDSKEWQDIEDQTIERGTELLNVLLYISEATETDTEMDVEDFLYEFLLVDEDEFQDEHRIYEEVIANQELVEENASTILEVAKRLPDELEIRELFVPLMLFFKDTSAKVPAREYSGKLSQAEHALLSAIMAYANA